MWQSKIFIVTTSEIDCIVSNMYHKKKVHAVDSYRVKPLNLSKKDMDIILY